MNLALIILAIAAGAIPHVGIGIFGIIKLATAFRRSNDWKTSMKIGAMTSGFFGLATMLWLALLFLLPRTHAPIPFYNYPSWILLVLSIVSYAVFGKHKSEYAIPLATGVCIAVPGSAIFAYTQIELLESVFGAIRFY